VRNWRVNDNWFQFFVKGGTKKKDPILPLPSDLEDRVSKIVNQKDCAEYITNLLTAVAQRDGEPLSYKGMDLFARVKSEGGFHLKNLESGHAGDADFKGTKRVIYVQQRSTSSDPRVVEHTLNGYAMTVVNELMHHARKSRSIYTDRTLARAAFSLLTQEEQGKHPLPDSDDEETNSTYFHPLLNLHCRSATGE